MRRYNLVIMVDVLYALMHFCPVSGMRSAPTRHARIMVFSDSQDACRREDLYTGQFLRFGRFIETSDTLGSADSVVSPRFVRRLREA